MRTRPMKSLAAKIGSLLLLAALAIAVSRGWLPASVLQGTGSGSGATAPAREGRATTREAERESHRSSGDSRPVTSGSVASKTSGENAVADKSIADLFRAKKSDAWVESEGRVERLLDDDRETRDGSDRHQRFLVRVDGGVTVLIAHNIDAAERVPLRVGDWLRFRGEYEWTAKGGTVHFTHAPKYKTRDAGKAGWIEYAGIRYE